MKKPEKILIVIMTLLMSLSCFSRVFADDGSQEEDTAGTTYSARYDFVLEGDGDLPEEVMALLPETRTGLKNGTTVRNETFSDVEIDESVYSFLYWSVDEFTINGSDVQFTGTWKKRKDSRKNLIRQEISRMI